MLYIIKHLQSNFPQICPPDLHQLFQRKGCVGWTGGGQLYQHLLIGGRLVGLEIFGRRPAIYQNLFNPGGVHNDTDICRFHIADTAVAGAPDLTAFDHVIHRQAMAQ